MGPVAGPVRGMIYKQNLPEFWAKSTQSATNASGPAKVDLSRGHFASIAATGRLSIFRFRTPRNFQP
jgi:hypothetical protein